MRVCVPQRDADRWEEGRLRASGMVTFNAADDDDDDQELRTHVVVHDTKPPFLDGRVVYSQQSEPVMPVKDPTSDMAVFAKKGSQLMRDVRERYAPAFKVVGREEEEARCRMVCCQLLTVETVRRVMDGAQARARACDEGEVQHGRHGDWQYSRRQGGDGRR